MTPNTTDANTRRKRAKSTVQNVTLGPVEDLEVHVRSDWWQTLFNSLYLKTDADLLDDMEVTRKEVDLIVSILGLAPEERTLDLCCGQGRHVLELARRGFSNVEGMIGPSTLSEKPEQELKRKTCRSGLEKGMQENFPILQIPLM